MEDDVRIGSDEIASIQNQLQHLKINPYPECKGIIFDDTEKTVDIHQGNSSAECSYTMPSDVSFLGLTETSDSMSRNLSQQSVPPPNQLSQEQHYYYTGEVNQNLSNIHRAPSFRRDGGDIGSMAQQGDRDMYREQQLLPQTANMTLQFMQAVQKSISQVVDLPFFGYEQVKPDYQFDEDVFENLNSTQIPPTAFAQPTIVESRYTSNKNENPPVVELSQSTTLSPRTMADLYETLEEYSESYDLQNDS